MDIKIKAIPPIKRGIIEPIKLFQPKEADQESVTKKLNKITAKLESGKRLTGEEKAFLLRHSPGLYETVKRVEIRREALKSQLEHARSKEEVNSIIGNALSGVSKKDPDMEYVVAAIQDEAKTFKATDGYKKLPDSNQEAKGNYAYHPYKSHKTDDVSGLYGRNGEFL